jgi:hypothetical protein
VIHGLESATARKGESALSPNLTPKDSIMSNYELVQIGSVYNVSQKPTQTLIIEYLLSTCLVYPSQDAISQITTRLVIGLTSPCIILSTPSIMRR